MGQFWGIFRRTSLHFPTSCSTKTKYNLGFFFLKKRTGHSDAHMNQDLSATRSKIGVERRFLLLDSRIVSTTTNMDLTVGSVEKHSANPLFVEDQPWEQRFDNFYGNIVFDVEEEVYKCWYSPFIVANSSRDKPLKDRLDQAYTGHKNQ